ncbi:uncharacterized protein LOC111876800 [Lactuca sativa]|uniref:uncharacterized protein LOC111876800 n=1 Tax=Lactuca sativa TaxID=4236 RepID=UPI000CD8113B|nr:uncharacterized protein LOC111876800 [Lactuca sativa]
MDKFITKKTQKFLENETQTVNEDNLDDNDYVDVDVDVNDNANDNVDVDDNADFHTFDIFDPKNWDVLDSNMINILTLKGPKRDLSIIKGPKDKHLRRFYATYYTKTLPNRKKCDRDWLVYSKEIDNFFFVIVVKYFEKGVEMVN